MIALYDRTPTVANDEFAALMEEIGNECNPLMTMISSVDAVEIYRVFFHRPNPPKGTWMKIDEIGNIWLSSRKEGRNYDVIPHEDVVRLLKEAVENYVDIVGVNSRVYSPHFLIVSIPLDEMSQQATRRAYNVETVVKLRASKGLDGFTGTVVV